MSLRHDEAWLLTVRAGVNWIMRSIASGPNLTVVT